MSAQSERQDGWYWLKRNGYMVPGFLESQRDPKFMRGEVWRIASEPGAWAITEDQIGPRIESPSPLLAFAVENKSALKAEAPAPEEPSADYNGEKATINEARVCLGCGRTESGWRYNRCPHCGEMADGAVAQTPKYLNDLLRGRELVLGIPTPLLDQPKIVGREEALKQLWLTAPQDRRDYIEKAIADQDAFIQREVR